MAQMARMEAVAKAKEDEIVHVSPEVPSAMARTEGTGTAEGVPEPPSQEGNNNAMTPPPPGGMAYAGSGSVMQQSDFATPVGAGFGVAVYVQPNPYAIGASSAPMPADYNNNSSFAMPLQQLSPDVMLQQQQPQQQQPPPPLPSFQQYPPPAQQQPASSSGVDQLGWNAAPVYQPTSTGLRQSDFL
jgi:hypothetical protein